MHNIFRDVYGLKYNP